MAEAGGRASTRLDPETAWTVVTDAPLKGLAFAREAGRILAWDEGNQLYLLMRKGSRCRSRGCPHRIAAGAISDDGSLIALLGEGTTRPAAARRRSSTSRSSGPAPTESSFLAIDPHGRYVAVGSRMGP